MVEMETLQHLVSDRVLALAQHALDAGMKYAVLDTHRQDGLICVITASYSMADGIANTTVPCKLQVGQSHQYRRHWHRPLGPRRSLNDEAAFQLRRLQALPAASLRNRFQGNRTINWFSNEG